MSDIGYYCPIKSCLWKSGTVAKHETGQRRQAKHLREVHKLVNVDD